MTDENPLHSGSRWEPAAHPTRTPRQPAAAGASATPASPASSPGRPRPNGARRGVLTAAAVGLVAVGGLGGLAFGHVASDEGGGPTGQVSQLRNSDDQPAYPGGGTPPPGTLPSQPPSGDLGGDLGDDGGAGDDQGSGSGTSQPGSPT